MKKSAVIFGLLLLVSILNLVLLVREAQQIGALQRQVEAGEILLERLAPLADMAKAQEQALEAQKNIMK